MTIPAPLTSQRWFRFALAGAGNTLLSQALLVLLLGVIPVGAATLVSQVLHACCGYLTSAKVVFGRAGSPWRYGAIVAVCWLANGSAHKDGLAGLQRRWDWCSRP